MEVDYVLHNLVYCHHTSLEIVRQMAATVSAGAKHQTPFSVVY